MPLAQAYRERHLRRIWNEVVSKDPRATEESQRKKTLAIYNKTYGESADGEDLDSAFDNVGDAFR